MKTLTFRHVDTRQLIVAELADTFWARTRGLLWRDQLAANRALLIRPCNCVHTFGMHYPLDIVFLDRHHGVLAVHRHVDHRHILFHYRAAQVMELLAGGAARYGIVPGHRLELQH